MTAVVIRLPLAFEVTVAIDPQSVADDATVGIVGVRLTHMGGSLVGWRPDLNRRPAVAQFEFPTPNARDRFIAAALEIPGVSVLPPH